MALIQLRQLSMDEAEQCVAEIWKCLEEFDMPSPRISFKFHDSSRTSMTMNIRDPLVANTILNRLFIWVEAEQGLFDGDRHPQLTTSARARGQRAAAPLGFVLAAEDLPASGYAVSRPRRK